MRTKTKVLQTSQGSLTQPWLLPAVPQAGWTRPHLPTGAASPSLPSGAKPGDTAPSICCFTPCLLPSFPGPSALTTVTHSPPQGCTGLSSHSEACAVLTHPRECGLRVTVQPCPALASCPRSVRDRCVPSPPVLTHASTDGQVLRPHSGARTVWEGWGHRLMARDDPTHFTERGNRSREIWTASP